MGLLALLISAFPGQAAGEGADRLEPVFAEIYSPEAEIGKSNLFLSEKEVRRVEKRARETLESRLIRVYTIRGPEGRPAGYAFLQTRTVRTKPATFLVALDGAGKVKDVRILGWGEPPEYKPGDRWLAQFTGRKRPGEATLGSGIAAVSGATYTSRTLTAGVRWALSVYRVKLAKD